MMIYFFNFSDAFDLDNGLQIRGKNGVTAFYIYMLNLDQENRSKRDGFLTVMVLKNSQIKTYGINECLKRLVMDLTKFVQTGFQLPNGKTASVRVVQYRGDNLEKAKLIENPKRFCDLCILNNG